MPGVQEGFMALGGHPEFSRIVIEPDSDTKTGTNIYHIRAESEKEDRDTFVRATFSKAELNVVALALFLAVTRANESNLAVSVLDDPSQSLDIDRERALADVLHELSQDRQVIVATEEEDLARWLIRENQENLVRLVHEPYKGTALQR
jgi:DNA repair exonuclease SbcCD ATPase subunit